MNRIKNYKELNITPNRKIVLDLIEAALDSIDPENVFAKNFSLYGEKLKIHGKEFDLADYGRICLLGFGKGSAKSCKIIEEILGERLSGGLVIDVTSEKFSKIRFTLGTHPLPSEKNLEFAQKVVDEFGKLGEKDLVLVVTCGGGSALFELSIIPLDKLREVNEELLHSGANIHDMNVMRKHLSKVKGGGLAKIIFPATVINLVFSDVPGNDLTVIASAPTVFDPTTREDAYKIFVKFGLNKTVSLSADDFIETPKDPRIFDKVNNIILLSNKTALEAMRKKARSLGINARIYSEDFQGNTLGAGSLLIKETDDHEILLVGGETTLRVKGDGEGGRNQELVLAALKSIDGGTVIASFDSDGWDNSPLAGALGDTETARKARSLNLDPQVFLNRNDSLNFFKKVGDGIETGRLASNVSDLMIVFKP